MHLIDEETETQKDEKTQQGRGRAWLQRPVLNPTLIRVVGSMFGDVKKARVKTSAFPVSS